MKIKFSTFRIKLNHSFGISRSSHDYYDIVYFYIVDGNIIGRGEAAPSNRYNESTDYILSVLKKGISLPESFENNKELWRHIKPQLMGIHALEAAANMAIWDWWGQKEQKAVYDILSLDVRKLPMTSYTIAIGDMKELDEKIELSSPYNILKVKLGTPKKDKEIIDQIRLKTNKVIRVDANEGWDYDVAKEMSFWLAERNVEFIEQPFSAENLKDTASLRKVSPLPLYADENSISSADISKIKGVFDGINIKLMKCGGIDEALKMIKIAKSLQMRIMLGCMIESSVGITAAAQLAGEVDAVDLDGNLLINNDPYKGVEIVDGRLKLSLKNFGMGISLVDQTKDLL
jgi:L-alanine-DL-glutamate epimerase-like enolase superfamily enzyme